MIKNQDIYHLSRTIFPLCILLKTFFLKPNNFPFSNFLSSSHIIITLNLNIFLLIADDYSVSTSDFMKTTYYLELEYLGSVPLLTIF